MRFMTIFALSVTTLLTPVFAISDPVQGSADTNVQSPATSTAVQPQPPPSQTATTPAQTAAPATASSAQPATSAAGTNLDQIVCKSAPPKIGSRLGGGRECHSQREWNRIQKEAQDVTRQQEREGFSTPGR